MHTALSFYCTSYKLSYMEWPCILMHRTCPFPILKTGIFNPVVWVSVWFQTNGTCLFVDHYCQRNVLTDPCAWTLTLRQLNYRACKYFKCRIRAPYFNWRGRVEFKALLQPTCMFGTCAFLQLVEGRYQFEQASHYERCCIEL